MAAGASGRLNSVKAAAAAWLLFRMGWGRVGSGGGVIESASLALTAVRAAELVAGLLLTVLLVTSDVVSLASAAITAFG